MPAGLPPTDTETTFVSAPLATEMDVVPVATPDTSPELETVATALLAEYGYDADLAGAVREIIAAHLKPRDTSSGGWAETHLATYGGRYRSC